MRREGHYTAVSGSFYLMFIGLVFSTVVIWQTWGKDATVLALSLILLILLVRDYMYG